MASEAPSLQELYRPWYCPRPRYEGISSYSKLYFNEFIKSSNIPDDPKNTYLKTLENSENLKLFRADILDPESLTSAIRGCEGVFHSACPVPAEKMQDPEARTHVIDYRTLFRSIETFMFGNILHLLGTSVSACS